MGVLRQNSWVGQIPPSTPSPLPFLPLLSPSPPPLLVGPLNTARGSESVVAPPAGFEGEPQWNANLVHFSLNM